MKKSSKFGSFGYEERLEEDEFSTNFLFQDGGERGAHQRLSRVQF